MTNVKPYWILGLIGVLAVMLVPVIALWPKTAPALDDPWPMFQNILCMWPIPISSPGNSRM